VSAQFLPRYLDALFGAEPRGGFIEVRSRIPTGMRQEFIPCERWRDAARVIERRGGRSDTYVGVAPRRKRSGKREAVERVHALYVDADSVEAQAAVMRFDPPPAIIICSGFNLHAYWPLKPPVGPDEAEWANRRLAHALGADPQAVDAARILRPPGTFNFKKGEPVPVRVVRLEAEIVEVDRVIGRLEDPPTRQRRATAPSAPAAAVALDRDDPLHQVPAPVYVEDLTGQTLGRDRKIACPFHDDRTPSLHVYDDHWHCFGCDLGGTIIDFGAALYGIEPRGRGYYPLRRRIAAALLGRAGA
jgi:hypothetical protein